MPSAGDLSERVAFASETSAADDYGNEVSGYTDQFTVWAGIRFLRGTEPVIAQRLQGVQPVIITVRASSDTNQVDTSWRARDVRSGTVFNIRSVTPTDEPGWIDFLTEAGREQP